MTFSVLVVNVKGGCGKTTIATTLASAFAVRGHATTLVDVDRQRSSMGWIARRPAEVPAVTGLDWSKDLGKLPRTTARLIIDAPAALKRGQVEELVALANTIVLPVQPGVFDQDATRRFLDRLEELKPVMRGKKPVAVIGNRLKARTKASDRLDQFLGDLGHQVVTRLRESQLYPESALAGLGLFDLPGKRAAEVQADWQPLLAFLDEAAAA